VHPDRRAVAKCQRYERGYCQKCLDESPGCPDAELRCKYRPQCLVHAAESEPAGRSKKAVEEQQ